MTLNLLSISQPHFASSPRTHISRRIESTTTHSQPQDESTVSRIKLPELDSAVGQSQLQLISSRRNSSQPQDRISYNSYSAAGTRVSCRMESAVICIQPQELESVVTWVQLLGLATGANRIQPPKLEFAAGQNQSQLVFSPRKLGLSQDRISKLS